ncbi:uncharacterized protein LOC129759781 [Uranotaenia lowii]|uniref:uncharacterized protein LOC129759781 n=1 Tax=Uranotaenia lowii TaxID=190385 RepID=UPI002478CFA2|nr:uncharacterized protein LOC129759781 [Uranotaenia lowii]
MADSKRSSSTAISSVSNSTSTGGTSSSKSSRKSKNDLIRTIVGGYLKQRNYLINDRFRKSDLILTQSSEQIVMNTAIENEISKANSFLFSNIFCLNNNPAQVDQHFAKLCSFIKYQKDAVRKELSELVFPLLCHLYIEMLKGRDWRPAIEFLRKHAPVLVGPIEPSTAPPSSSPLLIMNQKINGTVEEQQASGIPIATVQSSAIIFTPTSEVVSNFVIEANRLESFKQLIQKLSQITRIQDLDNDDLTLQFRSCQYVIRLSSVSIVALRRYLAKHGHSLVLQILRNWFSFETNDDKDFLDYNPDTSKPKPDKRPRLLSPSNGIDLLNGLSPMDHFPEQEQPLLEYDFSEHSDAENTKFLLRNGFTSAFIRHKIREMNGSDDDGTNRLMDLMDDDDDEDDTTGYLPGLAAISPVTTKIPEQKLDPTTQPAASTTEDISGLFRGITCAERLKKLKDCTEKLNQYHSPLCIYQVENVDNDRLSAVAIDDKCCHLASGFEDATIMLWSVNRSTQIGRKPYAGLWDKVCCWNVTSCKNSFNDWDESEDDDEEGGEKGYVDAVESTSREKLNKLLPPHSRQPGKRDRWKQYMERKCSENAFTETGGITLRGHSNAVTDLLFSNHYPLLLSVSRDLTMRAWQASDYNCRAVYRGHNHPIWCVTESPTGLYLATGSRDTTARLWSTDREFPLQIYVGHTQDVDTVAFHPNGNYLATGSTDLTVRLWCVTSGKLFRIFTDCKQPIQRIAFSPDGKYLATAGEETKVRVFDLAAGSQLTELRDHTSAVSCVTWSDNSRHLATAGTDGTVRIWDAVKMVSSSSSSSSSSSASVTASNQSATTGNSNTLTNSGVTNNGINHSSHKTLSSSSSSNSSNSSLLLAYSTGCRRIYRLHYNQYSGSLGCIGNS